MSAGEQTGWDSLSTFGMLPPGAHVKKGEALFPRIDVEKELASIAAEHEAAMAAQAGQASGEEKPAATGETRAQEKTEAPEEPGFSEITIDDFAKVELRLAKVVACEYIEKADKLLKLTVRMGGEERTICSGIRKWYEPQDLIGKTVVVVANLKPRKMRGIVSHGMILCASDPNDEKLSIVTTLSDMEDGFQVR